MDATPSLPYGPLLTRLLRPLQRILNVANRASVAPLLRWRLGWLLGTPLTGSLMLLRTRGRRSGMLREAPLGYVIRAGAVYCVAGYGETTPWYLNLLAEPRVEVVLPTRRFHARAEPVADAAEWAGAFRRLIASFAVVGRAVIGDISAMSDAELYARYHGLPIVRLTWVDDRSGESRAILPGAFDPGGRGWVAVSAVIGGALLAGRALRRGWVAS